MTAATMKALVQDAYGSPAVFRFASIPRPVPGKHQVLVRVRAAAVNPADVFMAQGRPWPVRLAVGLGRPRKRVRGHDLAGVVEAVGVAVTRFKVGDEVFGSTEVFGASTGAFAEYACGGENVFTLKPHGLPFAQAAAVPMAGLAALQGLRDAAQLHAGQHLLINGAAGGIGSFAVQIAKAWGAEVTGVCSTSKVERLRAWGADHVIDYTREDFTQGAARYDVILDNVANHSLTRLRRVLMPNGTLLTNSGHPGPDGGPFMRVAKTSLLGLFTRQKLRPFTSGPNPADLAALAELIESGQVTPQIGANFPFEDAPRAIALVADGHAGGKAVISF